MSQTYQQLLDIGAISEIEYRALCEISARKLAKLEEHDVKRRQLTASLTPNFGGTMDAEFLIRKMAERRAVMATKLDVLMTQRSTFSTKEGLTAAGTTAIDAMVGDVLTNAFAALKAMGNAGSPPQAPPSEEQPIEGEFAVVDRTAEASDADNMGS